MSAGFFFLLKKKKIFFEKKRTQQIITYSVREKRVGFVFSVRVTQIHAHDTRVGFAYGPMVTASFHCNSDYDHRCLGRIAHRSTSSRQGRDAWCRRFTCCAIKAARRLGLDFVLVRVRMNSQLLTREGFWCVAWEFELHTTASHQFTCSSLHVNCASWTAI